MARRDTTADDIPGTEPKRPAAPAPTATFVAPGELVPAASLVPSGQVAPGEREHWYWCGLYPGCPSEFLDLHGLHFPKCTEQVERRDPKSGLPGVRIPLAGCVQKLTRSKLERLVRRLPRSVFRYTMKPGEVLPDAATLALGEPRPATTIRVPSADEIAMTRQEGRFMPEYVPQTNDRPAAAFVYCVRLHEAEPAQRPANAALPPSIAEVGIELPPPDAEGVPTHAMPSPVYVVQ